MSPIDPYLGAQAPAQDFIRTFLDREIPAGLLFYVPFLPQTGNQAWAADKRIVVPTVETVDADGSYFASDGLIRRARANALRMEGLGGLIEGARMNVCSRSEQLDVNGAGAPWSHANASVTINAITAPDGATTADKVVEDNANNFHGVYQTHAAINRTWSIFAKAGERTWLSLALGGPGSGRYFDLANGVLGGTGVRPAPINSGIERLPNGWYRCWIVDNAATLCFALLATGDGADIYLGDGTSGAYFWGAQYESSTFPSSYISTIAAAVLRSKENLQYASANHIQAGAGTFLCAMVSLANSSWLTGNAVVLDTRVVTLNDGLLIYHDATTNRLLYLVRSGGADSALISSIAALNYNTTYIVACTWQANDFRFYLDGNLQGSDVVGAAPAAHDASIFVGQERTLGVQLYGNIAHFTIFNRAMSAAEIEQRSHFLRNQMARAS